MLLLVALVVELVVLLAGLTIGAAGATGGKLAHWQVFKGRTLVYVTLLQSWHVQLPVLLAEEALVPGAILHWQD